MKNLQMQYAPGSSGNSQTTIENPKNIVRTPNFDDKYELEIIDILGYPPLADEEKIIATPVLIKKLPPPLWRFIDDLSDKENVLFGLDLMNLEEEVKK